MTYVFSRPMLVLIAKLISATDSMGLHRKRSTYSHRCLKKAERMRFGIRVNNCFIAKISSNLARVAITFPSLHHIKRLLYYFTTWINSSSNVRLVSLVWSFQKRNQFSLIVPLTLELTCRKLKKVQKSFWP